MKALGPAIPKRAVGILALLDADTLRRWTGEIEWKPVSYQEDGTVELAFDEFETDAWGVYLFLRGKCGEGHAMILPYHLMDFPTEEEALRAVRFLSALYITARGY